MASEPFLRDLLVVELGDRLATGLCGALLQRLGARVAVVERAGDTPARASKWPHRAALSAGKECLSVDARDGGMERLRAWLARADVVVTCSDWQAPLAGDLPRLVSQVPIQCDLTAFGTAGTQGPWTDAMVQAFAGLMDTTGAPDGPPTPTAVPITECGAALFGASGILAALHARDRCAQAQRVEVMLFDTAFSMLSTFLPKYYAGGAPTRIGNLHPSMAPWNAYGARDGWVMLCSASDEMWGRVCAVIGHEALKTDPRFAVMSSRVANVAQADAFISEWVATRSVAQCVERFTAAAVPCGPVCTVAELVADPDLRRRGAFVRLTDPDTGRPVTVPGSLFRGSRATTNDPRAIPARGAAIADVPDREPRSTSSKGEAATGTAPGALSGLRVIEMGNYTTAPLAARNLAALGAYVVKVEPPNGELARAAPPQRAGQSYLCTFSNNDKRCVALDLQTDAGRALFADLLARADVFVENMKPGVLARFGFTAAAIEALNARLVYCSVTGFGSGSSLGQRPAMDATIQGMAGIMDLTRQDGVPYKVGVSAADIVGGQFALLAILAGLAYRARTGLGQTIDVSMHEVSAWLTQLRWNGAATTDEGRVTRSADGYAYEEDGRSTPIHSVTDIMSHPERVRRGVIVEGRTRDGTAWPLLASPIRLTPLATRVERAIGAVGADLDEVLQDWGMTRRAG